MAYADWGLELPELHCALPGHSTCPLLPSLSYETKILSITALNAMQTCHLLWNLFKSYWFNQRQPEFENLHNYNQNTKMGLNIGYNFRCSTCKRRAKFSLWMILEKFSIINAIHSSWSWDAMVSAASVHFTLGKLMISLSLSIRRKAAFLSFL